MYFVFDVKLRRLKEYTFSIFLSLLLLFLLILFHILVHLVSELSPFGIKVSVNCPPDTDTPGFANEQIGKPEETRLISEGGGFFQPDQVV